MATQERVSPATTTYAVQLERAGQRFAERTAQREANRRTVAERGVLYADDPERVLKRLARLNADWSLARSIERTRTEPAAATGSTLPLAPEEFGADVLGLERLMGRNDLTAVAFLEGGHLAARSVGRLAVTGPGGRRHYGTGFMVSPSLLMTNNHVLRSPEEAGRAVVEFNLQAGLDGAPLVPVVFPLDPQSFFATDAGLDFSVVAVKDGGDQPVRLEEFRWLPLDGSQGKVIVGEFVNIIQHPDGEPKQLALRENQVVDLLDRFVHYLTDTARGSSGSPVCNDQWEVVALHHSAVPKTDREGRPLTLDNALWQPWMGEHKLAWKANEGVRVSRILQALSRATLTGTPARLRDELLHPPGGPPPPSATAQVATGATAGTAPAAAAEPHRYTPRAGVVPGVGGVSAVTAGRSGPGAGVEITVPLHITVGVGAPSSRWPADGLSTAGGPGAGMVAGDAAGAAATPTPAVDGQGYGHPDATAAAATAAATAATAAARDLNAALLNLRLARDRVYYDERSDLTARDVYYAGLDPDTDGDRLREALTRLLESTHERRPSYSPSRLLYPWIELHPDRLLRSIYSGKTFTPEELIHADAAAEAARLTRLQEFLSRETTAGPAELTAELDALEAALPFNCEHVVPQSWFGKREPMRGDLHHLFACEPDCNSYRGNIRYHDFADYHETVRPGCGKREKEGFEPAHGKGAAARATLYFLLRYPGLVGDEAEELTPDRIPTLLAWHQEEPPTLYEHHRNTAIADVQGNRNPLVDHPDWAEHIDFAP